MRVPEQIFTRLGQIGLKSSSLAAAAAVVVVVRIPREEAHDIIPTVIGLTLRMMMRTT